MTFTKEQLIERARENVKSLKFASTQHAFEKAFPGIEIDIRLAEIALESLEAEPVAWQWEYRDKNHVTNDPARAKFVAQDGDVAVQPLFTAPPAPVSVPDFKKLAHELVENLVDCAGADDSEVKRYLKWTEKTCRAAMLQGAAGNSPAIPDDVRRMDWLVSKTVDVREPMVYGSHSLFWSQTITDEKDDYHATKLREQIDAAMAAENAAAHQQENVL